jgi:hypothetical protein
MSPITHPLHVVRHAFAAVSQTWPARHVVVPGSHWSVVSLHVSVPLQLTASAQFRDAPLHTAAAEQRSPTVQKRPSSQVVPVAGDHALVDVAGVQTRHWFAGLRVAAA